MTFILIWGSRWWEKKDDRWDDLKYKKEQWVFFYSSTMQIFWKKNSLILAEKNCPHFKYFFIFKIYSFSSIISLDLGCLLLY